MKSYGENSANQLREGELKRALTLTVNGLTNLADGTEVYARPYVKTEAGVMQIVTTPDVYVYNVIE